MSDIITIADALVLEFQNRIDMALMADTIVSRPYEVTHDLGSFLGRKIEIFPLTFGSDTEATRSENFYDFRYSFVVMERYRDKGIMPVSWVDDRVNFVEEYVFNPLDQKIITVIDGIKYWSTETEVTSVYDFDMLRHHKVFWSEVETVFRKVVPDL